MTGLKLVGKPPVRAIVFGKGTAAIATGDYQGMPCISICEDPTGETTPKLLAENGVTLVFASMEGALSVIKKIEETVLLYCRHHLTDPGLFDEFTPQNVLDGLVSVDVYPMKKTGENDSSLCGDDEAEFFDVHLRPNEFKDYHDPFEEWENLTREQAERVIARLEEIFPGISIDWVDA